MLHGLKRRIAGLLCSNKVAALFMKAAKSFSPAEELCHKVQELEQLIENRSAVVLTHRPALHLLHFNNPLQTPHPSGFSFLFFYQQAEQFVTG